MCATGSDDQAGNGSKASNGSARRDGAIVKLRADWSEFIVLLKRHGVRFLIVGAHALAVHGRPRYTDDFDVFVDASPANARRLQAALADFGFVEAANAWERMAEPYQIMTLGRVEKIDILTSIAGVSFRTAWRNRKRVRDPVLGIIGVLGLKELIATKRATGRPQDLADLALIRQLARGRSPGTRRRP